MNTNNNISIWRGSNTPPTKFHLWLKNNKLYHFDGIDWIENKVETASYENDGLMSKEDKERLDNLVYDGLDSTDIDKALSANLGNILLNKINDLKISAYKVKGSVENFDNLPTENLEIGDVYNILNSFYINNKKYPEGTNVVWTGTLWDAIGGTVDFKNYSTTEEINEIITTLENNVNSSLDNVNNSLNNINDSLDNLNNTKADKVYTDLLLETKVDKISGKGLSTNDYTTEEKNKLEFLSNLNLSYATSELYDLSSPNHKANINEIRINLNIMGISMINSVSIIVASDSSYNGDLYMRIYDINGNLVSTSNNYINLSLNLGQHITWYFTPFRLIKDSVYRFSAWDASGTKQTIRIHCASNKNEGVNCFDSNDSPHTDYCPAFGVNIGAIFADDLYKKILPKANKTYVDTLLATKIDKIEGKGLSTNDYTTADKNLVTTIPNKADKTYVDNKFATKANLSDVSFNANNASRIRTDDMRYMGIAFDTNDVNDGIYDTSADVANLSVGDTFDFREGYENRGNISSAMRLYIGETIVVLSSDITAILTEAGPRIMQILVKSNEDNMCVYKCNKPDCWIQIYGTGANYRIYKKPYVFGLEDLYKKVDEISSNYVDASTFISKADDLDIRKADKTYVDTQLETKANTGYVNAQVEILTTALETKVNKVSGKSLSTNDYTTEEKNLVATIPSKASEEYVDENILQLAKQRTSFVTHCFSDCDSTHEAKCKSITLSGGELGFGFKSIFSVTIKIAESLSLLNQTSTYLHIKDLFGNSIGVSMNGVKQMQNLGKYATWFFDSVINTSGGPIVLSLHTTNVASSASDSNLVKIIAHVNQNEGMKGCGVTDENGTHHTDWTPALGINVVNLSAIYPQIKELQKYRMAYATSELPDISTTGHKANIKEIRINQNIMGISLVNSVSIMVASDSAYSGALELRVYDINDNLIATSNNTVNLSQNLGKYVTWYFTPFQLNTDAVYRFSVWSSGTSQVMRIHVASGKSEGITCYDQNNSPHTDYCPAFGINISAIFADDLRKSIKEVNLALGNEINQVHETTINLSSKLIDVDKQLSTILPYLEESCSYGIQFDTSVSSPTCTRIGSSTLHKTLPILSKMRGCLLQDDGTVYKYLNASSWGGETLDGSKGQVMIEIPEHYRKCTQEGTICTVRLSELPIEGYKKIPKMYVSAYEASIQRSTGKLCSVANHDADYRGGSNYDWDHEYDGTYRTLLGMPVTSLSRTDFRKAARKRNTANKSWNCYLYHVHKAIFWLFVVEYATLNSQEAYNAELTAEGYHQGGLGDGVSGWSYSDWSTFNNGNPFVPCGHTNGLGNNTGVVTIPVFNEDYSESRTFKVPRYRGIENLFGHIWKWTDGINVRINPTEDNGGNNLSNVFVCEDPTKLNDIFYDDYKHIGNEARTEGYVKEIIFGEDGEIIPFLVGGGSTQFFCDYHYTNIPTTKTLRGVLFGGDVSGNTNNGLIYASSGNVPSSSHLTIGSRLCFIPSTA